MKHYVDYARWLLSEHGKFVLEAGAIELGPRHSPTAASSPPWKMDWLVRFSDGRHAHLKERWFLATRSAPRSANLGYRRHFSFHYGPTNPAADAAGFPQRDPQNYPPIFRIDLDRWGPHIHLHGNEHIEQSRVHGLTIETVDPFDFMNAIAAHRADPSKDFDAIMAFKVTP